MILEVLKQLNTLDIVLASGSPRRLELMQQMGIRVRVMPSGFAEDLQVSEYDTAEGYVEDTSYYKAKDVLQQINTTQDLAMPDVIISADTIVVRGEMEILGKPKHREEAMQRLRLLSGRTHRVMTAFTILVPDRNGDVRYSKKHVVVTSVTFAELSDEEIAAYVDTGEPMDKAGAYGIQGMGGLFVSGLVGCYYNVMGLPIHTLALELRNMVKDGVVSSR